MKQNKKYFLILFLFLLFKMTEDYWNVQAESEIEEDYLNVAESEMTEDYLNVQTESEITEEILKEIDIDGIQRLVDQVINSERFSLNEILSDIMNGQDIFSKETVQDYLQSLFFYYIVKEKDNFAKIAIFVLIAAIFSNFAVFFEEGQIGEISFYITYLLIFTLGMNQYSMLSNSLEGQLKWLKEFMQVLAPSCFLTVAASEGATTAAVFYQGVLLIIWGIEYLMLSVLLPIVNIYILIKMLNHLSKEELLSKMAELMESGIGWSLKTMVGVITGMQLIKNLIAPVMDSMKRNIIGKTASAIPGIGNAVNMVTELVLTSAVFVRNSFGIAILILMVLTGIGPVFYYGILSVLYRLLAALFQPVSDKRIIGCLITMGEGCSVLLRIILTAEIMCMLTFLIIMAGLGGGRAI